MDVEDVDLIPDDDPEIAGELAALFGESDASAAAKTKPKGNPKAEASSAFEPVDIAALVAKQERGEDEMSDIDMNDPELLAEFGAIAGEEAPNISVDDEDEDYGEFSFEEVESPMSHQHCVSLAVLLWTRQTLQAQLPGTAGDAAEELNMEIDAVKLKETLLTNKVMSGELSQDQYVQDVRARAERDCALAEFLKGRGSSPRDVEALKQRAAVAIGELNGEAPPDPVPVSPPKPHAAAPPKPQAASPPAAGPMDEDDDEDYGEFSFEEVEDTFSAKFAASLSALDWSVKRLESLISKEKDPDTREEFEMERDNCKLQAQLLVSRVESGELTQEKYIADVRARADRDRRLAKFLKVRGRQADAADVEERCRVSETELAGGGAPPEESAQAPATPAKPAPAEAQPAPDVVTSDPSRLPAEAKELSSRFDWYKDAASKWMNAGGPSAATRAKALFSVAKELKELLAKASAPGCSSRELAKLLKSAPPAGTTEILMGQTERERAAQISTLQSRCSEDCEAAKQRALGCLRIGTDEAKAEAREHARTRMQLEAWVKWLTAALEDPLQPPPGSEIGHVTWTYEKVNDDVPEKTLRVEANPAPGCEMEFENCAGGYLEVRLLSDVPVKITLTGPGKGTYDLDLRQIKPETLERQITRSRVQIEMYRPHFMSWLRGYKSVGKTHTAIRCEQLLRQSEVVADAPMLQDGERRTSKMLKMRFQLKRPIHGRELVRGEAMSCRLTVLPQSLSSVTAASSKAASPANTSAVPVVAESTPAKRPAPVVDSPAQAIGGCPSSGASQPTSSSAPGPASQAASSRPPGTGAAATPAPAPQTGIFQPPDMEEAMHNPFDPRLFGSVEALQHTLEQLDALSGKLGWDDVEIRRIVLDSRMQMIIGGIQGGTTSMEDYMAACQAQVGNDTRLAIALKKDKRVGEAAAVMRRIKVIKDALAGPPE